MTMAPWLPSGRLSPWAVRTERLPRTCHTAGIFCDEVTSQEAKSRVNFKMLPAVKLKGNPAFTWFGVFAPLWISDGIDTKEPSKAAIDKASAASEVRGDTRSYVDKLEASLAAARIRQKELEEKLDEAEANAGEALRSAIATATARCRSARSQRCRATAHQSARTSARETRGREGTV